MALPLDESRTVYCLGDFKFNMPVVTGGTALLHRTAGRLQTPYGRVPWWPDYGFDVRSALLSNAPPQRVAARAIVECEKDEQVEKADCTITDVPTDGLTRRFKLWITLFTASGPFVFTMSISDAAATLIELERSA